MHFNIPFLTYFSMERPSGTKPILSVARFSLKINCYSNYAYGMFVQDVMD